MLTVADLHLQREARARVNHETYKTLWEQVQDCIRTRADNKASDLVWQVPPLVPGRPVFSASHAARYVADKLRHGGFEVSVAAPQPDVQVLYISWKRAPQRPAAPQRTPRRSPARGVPPPAAAREPLQEASRTLEKLKARLRL